MSVQTGRASWLNNSEKEIEKDKEKKNYTNWVYPSKVPFSYSWHNFVENPHNGCHHKLHSSRRTGKSKYIKPETSRMTTHQSPFSFLWPEIERTVKEQIALVRTSTDNWKHLLHDGNLDLHIQSQTDCFINPIKAVQVVHGCTGHEMCYYFFSPQHRFGWETTLEKMRVLETISDDTLIFHQVHKRIWPISQRDNLFWSHIRQIPNENNSSGPNIWLVVNNSTEHPDHPANADKLVRLSMQVCLYCETELQRPKDGTGVSRDDIACRITYCSFIDPGGWTPLALFRSVSRREYPKFLKKFTAYVKEQTKDKPVMY